MPSTTSAAIPIQCTPRMAENSANSTNIVFDLIDTVSSASSSSSVNVSKKSEENSDFHHPPPHHHRRVKFESVSKNDDSFTFRPIQIHTQNSNLVSVSEQCCRATDDFSHNIPPKFYSGNEKKLLQSSSTKSSSPLSSIRSLSSSSTSSNCCYTIDFNGLDRPNPVGKSSPKIQQTSTSIPRPIKSRKSPPEIPAKPVKPSSHYHTQQLESSNATTTYARGKTHQPSRQRFENNDEKHRVEVEKFHKFEAIDENDRCELFGCFNVGGRTSSNDSDSDGSSVNNNNDRMLVYNIKSSSERTFRYDRFGRLIRDTNGRKSDFKVKKIPTKSTVVICKLTPKLSQNTDFYNDINSSRLTSASVRKFSSSDKAHPTVRKIIPKNDDSLSRSDTETSTISNFSEENLNCGQSDQTNEANKLCKNGIVPKINCNFKFSNLPYSPIHEESQDILTPVALLSANCSLARVGQLQTNRQDFEPEGYEFVKFHSGESPYNKEIMTQRRNTLDRLQRLGFGRKSSPCPSPSTSDSEKYRKSSEKSERLKELTELLRGNRASSTPPPIPPPRKPRQGIRSHSNSLEKPEKQADCQSHTSSLLLNSSDDILLMDEEVQDVDSRVLNSIPVLSQNVQPSKSDSNLQTDHHETKLSQTISENCIQPRSPPPTVELRAPQKNPPCRSASFSQIDYCSGKYIKSTIGALRDRFKREKSIDSSAGGNGNATPTKEPEDRYQQDYIFIPLKKTELNISLTYDSPEPLSRTPEVILEEDGSYSDNNKFFDDSMNPLTEVDNLNLPASVDEKRNESEVVDVPPNLVYESYLAEMPLESPPEFFLQTATTCLIPVPVYECAAQELSSNSAPEQWVDVDRDEVGLLPEVLDPIIVSEGVPDVLNDNRLSDPTPDVLPIISVSHYNHPTPDEEPSSPGSDQPSVTDVGVLACHEKQNSLDYPEVRKRSSQCDNESVDPAQLTESIAQSLGYPEEKRRIDKSKRRKGMYIENADWTGPSVDSPSGTRLDFSATSLENLNRPALETIQTPTSLHSVDSYSPDADYGNKLPIWPKPNRRKSLVSQSSEDNCSSSGNSPQKNKEKFKMLHTDSLSDNESDRFVSLTTGSSGIAGNPELKRYSKRPLKPLRGPYGQMLEAEMKKPNNKYFEEILEELKDSECLTPRRERNSESNRSADRTSSHLPQYSNSMRLRKSNTYLPIPSHTRAASTPSQMESLTTTSKIGTLNATNKLSSSSMDNTANSNSSSIDRDFLSSSLSEISKTKKMFPKRSVSTPNDKMQNRSVDETQLSDYQRKPPTPDKSGSSTDLLSKNETTSSNFLPSPELLAHLLKGSSEKLISEQRQQMLADTRTHVVHEIFRNEQSYVESLQTVVTKYFKVLKTPEHAGMIDSRTVDEIFFMVPELLEIHQKFLGELKSRLDSWDAQQKVGDAFIEMFSKTEVLETYTSFVNNCNRAKDAIRVTKQSRPSFARFLESTAREHKGKLSLDNLLIKPVQKFPNYEMLFTRLIKHTDIEHPDQKPLQEVLKLVHDILVHINCKEREILENGQREATLRELEGVIEGVTDLVAPDRQFLLFDLVSMPSNQGARKERGFFLFNDLLIITSIKRRSGTIKKPNISASCPGSIVSTLDTNKYKFLTKIPLDNLDIVKTKDENLRKMMNEIEQLTEDYNKLQQIAEITATIKYPHLILEDTTRDLLREVQRQLSERQSNDAQLNTLELSVNSPNYGQKLTIVFSKTEKRTQWEEQFNEAKQKLVSSLERHPIPEFLTSIPIRKTRAGLQFTCAAPTLSEQRDVWVCNSDGYVGQVCVMSLLPEPNVTSCNGVCNARILCVASVPAYKDVKKEKVRHSLTEDATHAFRKSSSPNCHTTSRRNSKRKNSGNSDIQLDSNSSSDESELEGSGVSHREMLNSPALSTGSKDTGHHHQHQDSNSDETDGNQSTMWLGTEDGCIHVYNCTDNIRIKKNKIKIQHVSAVYSILYLDNRVFVSLANGDICVYIRDNVGWNTGSPLCISVGTVSSPVSKLLNVHGKLWCSIQGVIKVLDSKNLQVEHQIQISPDSKPVTNMAVSNNFVWISIQNSAYIKCFHSTNHELIFEVNLAPSVNKMLSNCDDIIRQHKAACLRVTSLLSCKDLIWIGTSAGVLLTIPAVGYGKGTPNMPIVTGIPHGHTGHVRFLTFVENEQTAGNSAAAATAVDNTDSKNKRPSTTKSTSEPCRNILIISGGDGYEDFRNSGANSLSEIAGREDSTNHLLIWQI